MHSLGTSYVTRAYVDLNLLQKQLWALQVAHVRKPEILFKPQCPCVYPTAPSNEFRATCIFDGGGRYIKNGSISNPNLESTFFCPINSTHNSILISKSTCLLFPISFPQELSLETTSRSSLSMLVITSMRSLLWTVLGESFMCQRKESWCVTELTNPKLCVMEASRSSYGDILMGKSLEHPTKNLP